ncbi:NADH:ubiquinone oxidoreductase complex I intermediate-associated protein 30 [Westerdykella ornata]|uniref:NADH:ubiquinone oxidoreductase complex I intermediate-associated protein 30 n=1 Tax=Westerdykella ornata TaxID=318751 RepID=A0A6A6JI16_WESOR|nr:NADH:ubiquinone oxidoreductase complex I intermediate-associated protein 30 [Westerdykella ornata]KAF2276037.1 NADH:ubiquinone oxidoreductase complex I intermediate-associated protein 30 [Westerdykella ornata]
MMTASKNCVLYGGSRGWDTRDWTASDDRVRGGKSVSHVSLPTSETLLFWGHLDYATLGSAGFASQRTTNIPPEGWDLSAYSGIVLELEAEAGRLNDKKFTFVIKDTILPKRPDGRERSSINWEFDFDVPRVSTGSTVWHEALEDDSEEEVTKRKELGVKEGKREEDEQDESEFEHIDVWEDDAAEEAVLLDAEFYVNPEDEVVSVPPAPATPAGRKEMVRVYMPWGLFQPTYRGRKKHNASDLDTKHIRQISIMVRSFFGEQSGDFALVIKSITAYTERDIDVEAQRATMGTAREESHVCLELP